MILRIVCCLAFAVTVSVVALGVFSCAPTASQDNTTPAPAMASTDDETSAEQDLAPSDAFWERLRALCGQAYAGKLVSNDEADADLAGQPMTMHVRECSEDRIEIPFHIGSNRSRTWVLTRHQDGLQLQHDHRHEDGSEDSVTLYGGRTRTPGSADAQLFPADEYSKSLFESNELGASVANVWSFEIKPGERFSYILRRPERHFQADFDLSTPVAAPPAPWGY